MHETQKVPENNGAITAHERRLHGISDRDIYLHFSNGKTFRMKASELTPYERRLFGIPDPDVKRGVADTVFKVSFAWSFAWPAMFLIFSIFTGKHSIDSPAISIFLTVSMVNVIVFVVSYFMSRHRW